jgi:hypothetical protein
MARKVTCKLCKNKGDTDTFYKLTDEQGKSKYYCNQEEYDNWNNEKVKRENLIKFIAEDVFKLEEGQIFNPVLLKRIKEMNSFYDYDVIHECFQQNKDTIHYWMGAKQFSSEYNMICYILKIIEGNINDIYNQWKFKKQQEIKQENNSVDLDIMNQLDNHTKNTKNEGGILAFLDEEDM